MGADATQRFSQRVEHYVRYRPGYPDEVVGILRREAGLTPEAVVVDLGSGTGISSELFLRHGNRVYGVEPNPEMRRAAAQLLARFPGFESVAGAAEETGLADRSVDFLVAAQAFHWFDPRRLEREAARILRPGGWGVVLWNTRRTGASPFMRAYEALLDEHGTDYQRVRHDRLGPEAVGVLFAAGRCERRVLANEQRLDLEGLKGRLLSSSYTPLPDEAGFDSMMEAVEGLFAAHQQGGEVRLEYDTELYFGRVTREERRVSSSSSGGRDP